MIFVPIVIVIANEPKNVVVHNIFLIYSLFLLLIMVMVVAVIIFCYNVKFLRKLIY